MPLPQIPAEALDALAQPLFRDHLSVPSGTIFLYGEIGPGMADHLAKCLHLLSLAPELPITIYLNSPGGCLNDGLGMYDLIRAIPNEVTIIAYGRCCSCAVLVLQAANDRVVSANTELMIHPGHSQLGEDLVVNLAMDVKKSEEIRDRMYKVLAKAMGISLKEAHQRYVWNSYFTPRQAIKAGLADRIL